MWYRRILYNNEIYIAMSLYQKNRYKAEYT